MTTQGWVAIVFAVVMTAWTFWPSISKLFGNVTLPSFGWGVLGKLFGSKTTTPTVTATPTFAEATSALAIIANFRKTVPKDALECAMFEAGIKKLTEAAA